MTPLRSFRSRLLFGALLCAAGLLGLAHLISIEVFHHYPQMVRTSHGTMIVSGLILIGLGLWQVGRGLSPFQLLRSRLAGVRDGRSRRIDGRYPTEVQPLVDDLNALLDHRDQAIRRALAKAGDLAHGLKTPLAVLAQEAERAAAEGHRDVASTVGQQVERMRRQIEYHLAHARAAASGATPGARCLVKDSADGLARTLLRLHADRGVTIQVNVAAEHSVRAQREDLDEMLGNLLDNACKWARTRVIVESSERDGRIVITVDDDGPGLDASMRDVVMQRGVRADEAAPGSGLGLAIVRELAELYGGSISLETAPAGGLRARLELPASIF